MILGEKMNQRKKIQKNTKKTQNMKGTIPSPEEEVRRFGFLILVIVIVLFLVYIVSTLLKGKDYSSIFDNSLDVSEIQYTEILIGTMLKQREDKYYVLIMDREDPYYEILNKYKETYLAAKNHEVLYTIDLGNIFNKASKKEETDLDTLSFKGAAFLLIENGEIKQIEENSATISTQFIEMTKKLEEA